MSEFKFACPVCGQHMMCDSSHGGSVMECPTCFQQITAPQAPTADAKFILTGTKLTEKRPMRSLESTATQTPADKKIPAIAFAIIAIALVAVGVYFFGGKIKALTSGWQAGDIGDVGAAGSFSQAKGVFTITGSGADVWGKADGFHFVFQPLDGDGAITTRVLNLKNTDEWAKAGVMIRESPNANSMCVVSVIRPDGQAQFIWRKTTGGEAESTLLFGGRGFPKWVKIARSGDTFFAYYKVNDGDEWKLMGTPQTINMARQVQIGLIVCAHKAGVLCEAQFDQISR